MQNTTIAAIATAPGAGGMGFPEKQGHALVKGLVPFPEGPVHGGITLGLFHFFCGVGRAEHPGRHLIALRTREPHHGNAACARCCCNCCNGRFLHVFSGFLSAPGLAACSHLPTAARPIQFHCTTKRCGMVLFFQPIPGKQLKIRPFFTQKRDFPSQGGKPLFTGN